MSRTKKIVGICVAALLVAGMGGTSWAAGLLPGSGKSGLSPKDYQEIQQLYGLYARDVDPGSPRDASWLFTPGGRFTVYGPDGTIAAQVSGKEDLADFYQGVRESQSNGTRHYNTTYVIQKTKKGALGSGYMLTVARDSLSDPWRVTGSGVYEDKLVRTKKGWRFVSRIFRNDTFVGDPTPFPTSKLG